MGRIKRFFGCVFLMFGGMLLGHTFLNAPYSRFEVAVGYIVIGLIFAAICIYFGLKWIELEAEK